MKFFAVIALLCFATGCNTTYFVREQINFWQLSRENTQANRAYRDAVGDHAKDETLLGTWTWATPVTARYRTELPDQELSLSLFKDGQYIQRQFSRSQQTSLFGIDIEEGNWANETAGTIILTPTQPSDVSQVDSRTINLNDWTNAFVEADQSLKTSGD